MGQPALAHQAFSRSQAIHEAQRDPGQAGVDAYFRLVIVQIPYEADMVQNRQRLTRDAQAFWSRSTHLSVAERVAEAIWAVECFLNGDWQQADEYLARQEWDSDFNFSFFGPYRLRLARRRGDFTTVWDAIRWKLPDGPETSPGNHNTFFVFFELQHLAIEIALDTDQYELARAWLEANDGLLDWSGAESGRAENRLLWARYHLLDGDPATARRQATRAFDHASDPRQPLALLATRRFLGHLDTVDGRFVDAADHLQTALDLASACETPFERALTLVDLARLRIAQNQVNNARELLDEVRAICEPLKAQPTLDQVAALEVDLEAPSPAPVPFGLTPRELDVLRLVAEGFTDPEVAERLFVSPRTVSSHLTSVYTKLGVSSRTAATRLAVAHGLL